MVWALYVIGAGLLVSRGCWKHFLALGYFRSKDGVVWLWHLLLNLHIYIYIYIHIHICVCVPVVFKPANFIQKEGKNSCFAMCNIYNEETAFYLWKKMVFFYASWSWHIHRFPCFRKEEDQNVQHWQLYVFHLQKRSRETIQKILLSCSSN